LETAFAGLLIKLVRTAICIPAFIARSSKSSIVCRHSQPTDLPVLICTPVAAIKDSTVTERPTIYVTKTGIGFWYICSECSKRSGHSRIKRVLTFFVL